ncbi:hypothetical protein ACFL5O_01070 [Myxococcota bacterium]
MLKSRSRLSVVVVSCVLWAPYGLGITGCGGQEKVLRANVRAGEMPEGSDYAGVYYDPYFGNLHLVRSGDTVKGKWRSDSGDAWGELEGEIKGNLLRYQWTQHKIGMVGPSALTKGRGYFVYKQASNEGDPDYIRGERGTGDSDVGQKWKGIKQHNVQPNPGSITPDEYEAQGVGGDWDSHEYKKPDKGGESDGAEDMGAGDSGGGDDGSPPAGGDDNDTDY